MDVLLLLGPPRFLNLVCYMLGSTAQFIRRNLKVVWFVIVG